MSLLWMASVKIKDLHRAWRGLQAGELKVGFCRAVEWYCARAQQHQSSIKDSTCCNAFPSMIMQALQTSRSGVMAKQRPWCPCRLPGSKVCIYARWQEDGPWLLNAAEAKDCTPLQRTSADKMKLCRPCKSHLASVGNFGSLSDGGAFVTFVTKARRRR